MLTGIVQAHIRIGHAFTVVCGFGCCYFSPCSCQTRVAFNHKLGRALVGLGHVLGDLAHAPLGGDIKLARILGQTAVEQGEH